MEKKEMVDFLKKEFGGEADDFDVEAAIWWFANDYHGGQWSDLYSILSTSEFKPGRSHHSVKDEGDMAEMMYEALEKRYSKMIKASLSDEVKTLIGKPGSASKVMALSKIFESFLKENKNAEKLLPKNVYRAMKKYMDADVFKFAYTQTGAEKELDKFLKTWISKHGKDIPKALMPHVKALSEELERRTKLEWKSGPKVKGPAKKSPSKDPKAPAKAPEKAEPVQKEEPAKEDTSEEEVIEVKETEKSTGFMEDLAKHLDSNHYQDLFHNLPANIQNDLKKVGLDPVELKKKKIMATRVAARIVETHLLNYNR